MNFLPSTRSERRENTSGPDSVDLGRLNGLRVAGWVAAGVSVALSVSAGAFVFGWLLGSEEWIGAGIVAGVSLWIVSVVLGTIRESGSGR